MKKRTTLLLILDLGILDFRFLPYGANALTTPTGSPCARGGRGGESSHSKF